MKVNLYQCDRCYEDIRVEANRTPPTVKYIDGRYMNEKEETLHLCDDCYVTFLIASTCTNKKVRKKFDKLADENPCPDA